MAQTPEIRIRLQYRAMRRSSFVREFGVSSMWMALARQWKRPVREIKRLVHGPGWDPVADRARRQQEQLIGEMRLAQVHDLMDVGRMDEARELFRHFWPTMMTPKQQRATQGATNVSSR